MLPSQRELQIFQIWIMYTNVRELSLCMYKVPDHKSSKKKSLNNAMDKVFVLENFQKKIHFLTASVSKKWQ